AENVILVTIDGMRWQEIFSGAEEARFAPQDTDARREYWRPTALERRAALMPFPLSAAASRGQIPGNQRRNNVVRVTNGKNFSYPGYQEILAGFPDPRIDSNGKIPNPNITVLEWLNGSAGFAGRIAAAGTWDVLPFILNTERSHLPVLTA